VGDTAHLGSGASMCAMHRRQSVATTMGFTTLDGLAMGTRCGNLDPGVVLYLIQEKRMTPQAVSDLLYHSSGLLGASGISDDMRTLLASDDPLAARAIALFVYRIGRELGSLAASLGGLLTYGSMVLRLDINTLRTMTLVTLALNGQAVFYVVRERKRL
jgi:acetate kinase